MLISYRSLVAIATLFVLFSHAASAITPSDARFLLTRTGFTPSDQEVADLAAQPSRAAAVSHLLAGLDFTVKSPVNWMTDTTNFPNDLAFQNYVAQQAAPLSSDPAIRTQQIINSQFNQATLWRSWWTTQLRTTKSPLAERLVLWLHNHFVAGLDDPYPDWYLQYMFRQCGTTSNLSAVCLLHGAIHDPCVMRYLNQLVSTAAAPVANFGREIMEIYTIGVSNYSEQDVSEMARALTGLDLTPDGTSTFYPRNHDYGTKTILGQTGNWGPDDVQRILLQQPAYATRLVNQLWQEFVSPTPDPVAVATIAGDLKRDPQMRLVPILGELLTSSAFWSPANRGTLVKAPVEFVIGALRQLGFAFPADQEMDVQNTIQGTGEWLWVPPNVRGFLTGTSWVNTATLLERQGAAYQLATMWQTQVLTPQYGTNLPTMTPAQYVTWATTVMADQPMLAPPTKSVQLPQAAQMLMSDPAYWLK